MDAIEGCYFAFRQRLKSIQQSSICECNACSLIPSLNLKLVAHYGSVVIHKVAGRSELLGSDVIMVHRLLKNTITETGLRVHLRCLHGSDRASIPPRLACGDIPSRTSTSAKSAGGFSTWTQAWEAYRERKKVYVGDDEAGLTYSTFIPAPAELVWEYLSSPQLRAQWGAGLDRIDQLDPTGRRRAGTVNHCIHGKDQILQEFIDWRPPRYYTSKATLPNGVCRHLDP